MDVATYVKSLEHHSIKLLIVLHWDAGSIVPHWQKGRTRVASRDLPTSEPSLRHRFCQIVAPHPLLAIQKGILKDIICLDQCAIPVKQELRPFLVLCCSLDLEEISPFVVLGLYLDQNSIQSSCHNNIYTC